MYYTTLNKIQRFNPCLTRWEKLLNSLDKTKADDEPKLLRYILDTLGIEDALWALRAEDGIERECRLFACRRAESVLHIFEQEHPNDPRPRRAIEVARAYAQDKATEEELTAAADAARAAAWAVAWSAMDSAWSAADAARAAARAAAWSAADAARAAAWAARAAAREDFIETFCTPKQQQPCS